MPDQPEPSTTHFADAALPDVLETMLQADADFARLLREAASLPEGSTKDSKYLDLQDRYDRYIPSSEVTAIARLLYMLEAYNATNATALDELITLHNERMTELASDTTYLARIRVPRSKLLEAQFSGPARLNAISNFRNHGCVAVDATTMGRLLVEFANKTQVDEAMRLLAVLGFFKRFEGSYHSVVYLSRGKLESLYRGYLAQVAQGVGEAVSRPKAVRRSRGRGTRVGRQVMEGGKGG